MPSKHFETILQECLAIHDRKSHDYSAEDNPFSNFESAAELVSWFNEPMDKVFACMIGIKLARLAQLKNGKVPMNESVRDNSLDLINYMGLWLAYEDSLELNQKEQPKPWETPKSLDGK